LKTELHRLDVSASGLRFAVVVSRWNAELTSSLAAGAHKALGECGALTTDVVEVVVPGAFELPLACLTAARTGRFDAVIALGVVIRGDTPHFDYVAGECAAGVMRASLDTGVPVLFGVITANTAEQASERAGDGPDNKGYEAAYSAVEFAHSLRALKAKSKE
jgi:6,7-dimethyl-8-ribityllumazine synthase